MIITPQEYSEKFLFKGKRVSAKTVTRRCEDNLLPSDHHARKLPGGDWVIEIAEETPLAIVVTKTNPAKPDIRTMNRKYFSF
jgi:hypothetical protein